jgi:hypothetical protein
MMTLIRYKKIGVEKKKAEKSLILIHRTKKFGNTHWQHNENKSFAYLLLALLTFSLLRSFSHVLFFLYFSIIYLVVVTSGWGQKRERSRRCEEEEDKKCALHFFFVRNFGDVKSLVKLRRVKEEKEKSATLLKKTNCLSLHTEPNRNCWKIQTKFLPSSCLSLIEISFFRIAFF